MMQHKLRKGRLAKDILLCLMLLFLAGTMFLHLTGFRFVYVVSGSMEPEIATGSLCIINTNTEVKTLKEGDVIAFRSGSMEVTHRIVRVDQDGFITKGDANESEDAGVVPFEHVIGKNVLWIPYAGMILAYLKTVPGMIIAGICIVAIQLLCVLYKKGRPA